VIPVEFVVLHYTGTTLRRTLEIFLDPARQASSHLVIDRDGTVYEVVPCLGGEAKRAWHAGLSRFEFEGRLVEGLNDCAIGIELVNPNGNVFSYSEAQYGALDGCLTLLASKFPVLADRRRVIGHETVAGFRGKCDPGLLFDWTRIHATNPAVPEVCSKAFAERLAGVFKALAPGAFTEDSAGGLVYEQLPTQIPEGVFEALSSLCEQAYDRR